MKYAIRSLLRSLFLALMVLSALTMFGPSADAQVALSTFQFDTEGWTISGDPVSSTPTRFGSGGSPGGFIRAVDAGIGLVMWWCAPPKFLGDVRTSYNAQLFFRLRQSTSGFQTGGEDIRLSGGGYTLVFDTGRNPGTSWTQYSVLLHESAGWHIGSLSGPAPTQDQFLAVLQNLVSLQIRAEYSGERDVDDLDSVVLDNFPASRFLPVPLPFCNSRLQNRDGRFPFGRVVLSGIPFIIPGFGNNIWDSERAGGPNPRSLDIPVNTYGVTVVHTLINTGWGVNGPKSYASLEFFGSEGAYFRKDLVGNEDIRDWNQNRYTNGINGFSTINVVSLPISGGEHRLDKQRIALPEAFKTQTLTRIRLSDNGATNFQRTFLAGVTVGVQTPIAFVSFRDGNPEIYKMNPDTTEQTRLTNDPAYDGNPVWSPDGKHIAFNSNRDGNDEIYVMDADGSHLHNLTNNPARDNQPAWSPDGRFITFYSNRDGNWEIYLMQADGSNPRNLTRNPADNSDPTWSPDGAWIAFSSDRSDLWGRSGIWIMNAADGSNPVRLTVGPADYRPSWSPDGSRIAFTRLQSGNRDIYVINVNGTNEMRLTYHSAVDEAPSWSPESNWILFTSNRVNGQANIFIMNADGSNPSLLTFNNWFDNQGRWSLNQAAP